MDHGAAERAENPSGLKKPGTIVGRTLVSPGGFLVAKRAPHKHGSYAPEVPGYWLG